MVEFVKFIFRRPLAWMISIFFLPACWAAARAFYRLAPSAFFAPDPGAGQYLPVPEAWAFLLGVAAYAVWHRFWPPEFLYTFAHEFTHLLFALLTGKKVRSFEVMRGSGKVGLSGTNPVITLAPYFFSSFDGGGADFGRSSRLGVWIQANSLGDCVALGPDALPACADDVQGTGCVAARYCAWGTNFFFRVHLLLGNGLHRWRSPYRYRWLGYDGFIRPGDLE